MLTIELADWPWEEVLTLPWQTLTVDIRWLTSRSAPGSSPSGLLLGRPRERGRENVSVSAGTCHGYSPNPAFEDVTDGKAWLAYEYEGDRLAAGRAGSAHAVAPEPYVWTGAHWARGLTLMLDDEPGFWQTQGRESAGHPRRGRRRQGA
jgi:DMSO/TMAO reductase YedYZ molybdopterin-dependent catalytic subunit